MATTVKGFNVKIGGDTTQLSEALKSINSTLSSLNKRLNTVNSLLKFDSSSSEALAQKQETLKQAIENTEQALEAMKNEQASMEEKMANGNEVNIEGYNNLKLQIEKAEQQLVNLKTQASSWTTVSQNLQQISDKLSNISDTAIKVGKTLTTSLTVPIVTALTACVSAASDWEDAWVGVTKTVDGTDEEMEALEEDLLNMATTLGTSATEIAEVAEVAGQLGVKVDDISKFTEVMVELGQSTNLSSDEVAEAIAQLYNVMGEDLDTVDQFAAALVDLGNNAATTESDILNMATRVAASGSQVGLTAQEVLALSTTLSSVGLEAEAGGSAISAVITAIDKAVALNSDTLETWADTAGMSVKEFSSLWEDDCMSAIQAIIAGMGDASSESENLNVLLDELGVTSLRQTDTMKRLSNASELLADMTKLSNEAWEDNTALTTEAEKRQATLTSQLSNLKEKVKQVAANIGEKLIPWVEEIIDKIMDWLDGIDDLNEEQVTTITKIGLVIAAIGPLITIFGKVTSVASKVTSGLANIASKLAEVIAKSSATETGAKILNTALEGMGTSTSEVASKITTLATEIGTMIGIIGLCAIVADELFSETYEGIGTLSDLSDSWEDVQLSAQEYIETNSSEITELERLKSSLEDIVDENGKVKEGYEDRAEYILNELSEATGVEYEIVDGVIQKYDELVDSIENVIDKQKAQLMLDAYDEAYVEALEEQSEAVENLNELYEERAELQKKIDNMSEWEKGVFPTIYNGYIDQLELVNTKIENQNDLIDEYGYTITNYEELEAATVEGSSERISEALANMNTSWEEYSTTQEQTLAEQIENQQTYIDNVKEAQQTAIDSGSEYASEIYEEQIETAEKTLEQLEESLLSYTTSVDEMTEEEKEAWQKLYEENDQTFMEYMEKLPPAVAEEIEEMVGVIDEDTSINDAVEDLGEEATDTFLYEADGNTWASDLISNVVSTLTSINSESKITSAVSKVAGWIAKYMGFSLPDEGPLSDFDESMPDMIDLMVKGIDSNKYKVNNAIKDLAQEMNEQITNLDIYQGNLSSNIIDSTQTVFTTPKITFNVQEMNEENLESCFKYINRKFGSKY